jgi:glycerophosphoryl diester phosphodiesterase
MSQNLDRTIEIIAHRGYSAIAPENTRSAFLSALQFGANSVEFDVQITADRVPVLFHDITLERTARVSGNLVDRSLSELQKLEIGSWFDERFYGETILTLTEALEILSPLQNSIYLDVKPHCIWSTEEVQDLLELLTRSGWGDRSILCSFGDKFIEQVRELTSAFTVGYSVENATRYLAQLERASADGNAVMISEYHIFFEHPEWVELSRDRGVEIVAWTVDSPSDRDRLVELGVDRIISNNASARTATSDRSIRST